MHSEAVNSIRDDIIKYKKMREIASKLGKEGAFPDWMLVAESINDPEARVVALTALALKANPDEREPMLDEALTATRGIDDPLARCTRLAELSDHLAGAKRNRELRHALDSAFSIQDIESRTNALVALSPLIKAKYFDKSIDELILAAPEINNVISRDSVLSRIAACLAMRGRLDDALAAATKITNPYEHSSALIDLARHLTGRLLDEAIQDAKKIKDIGANSSAVAKLSPADRPQALKTMIDSVRHAGADGPLTDRLQNLGRRLADLDLRGDVIVAVEEISDPRTRSIVLSALALRYFELGKPDESLVSHLSTDQEHIPNDLRCALSRRFCQQGRVDQSLRIATSISDSTARSAALVELAPLVPPNLVSETLESARSIGEPRARVEALLALLPRLDPVTHEFTLRNALSSVSQVADSITRCRLWVGLAARIPTDQREQPLREALASAIVIGDRSRRAQSLSIVGSGLAELPRAPLYSLWDLALRLSVGRTREDLLVDLGSLRAVIAVLGGPDAVLETFYSVQQVGRWWP